LQKQTKSGEPGTKRRKYVYFEQMLFLIPQTPDHATSSNYSPMTAMEKKTLMKDGRMKKVQMMVQPKHTRVERNRAKGIPRKR
jgi:hypothetical protein